MPQPSFDFGVLAMKPALSARQWRERARRFEAAGFSTLQFSDHFDRSPVSPLITMAALAQVTTSIRLGTLVLNNDFRHPAVLAKELATLETFAGERLELGLGAGWMDADYRVSGIPFRTPGVRISRLTETITILRQTMGGGEPCTFGGEHYAVHELQAIPRTQRMPPLLIGGGSKKILTLAGQTADIAGINLNVAEGHVGARAVQSAYADATEEKISWVRAAAGDRPIRLHLVAYWAQVTDRPREAAQQHIDAQGLPTTPDHLLASPHCLIGPASQLKERLAELQQRWGFDYLTLYDKDAQMFGPIVAELATT